MLPVPERDPAELAEIPERYARLLLEPELPPVAPPEPESEPPPPPEPVDEVAEARDRASVSGLLPFAEDLAALRDPGLTGSLETGDLAAAVSEAAPSAERSLITSSVGQASGGIDTAAMSRNTGGSGIGTRATTTVDNPVDGFAPVGGAVTRAAPSDLASRSREEIERVFDRNKGAIFALYNRALRANPALQGKVVLRLTILPNGTVSACEIVSSELGDADLEQKLVQRVLLFLFEAREVETITTTKPIDFFPA